MKKFGEGQQPFYAIVDIPEGDAQELTTVTDQVLNSLYGEFFNLLKAHGINPTTTTSADLKQVARAVWSAVATSNSFIDNGSADIKNLTHVKGGSFLYKNGVSADDGFTIEFVNKTANKGAVKVSVFDVENNSNHFNLVPLLDNNGNELTGGALRAGNMVRARYDVSKNAFIMASQFVFSAYVVDGDKTQEQINTLQKRKNAEFTSIFDFFAEEELTAYKAAPTTYDASKQVQAFFDYCHANKVINANAGGAFYITKPINYTGSSHKTNVMFGDLYLTTDKPLQYMLHITGVGFQYLGLITLVGASGSASQRKTRCGLLLGYPYSMTTLSADDCRSSNLYIHAIEVKLVYDVGVYWGNHSHFSSIGRLRGDSIGSLGTDNGWVSNGATFSSVTTTEGDIQQSSTLTVDKLPYDFSATALAYIDGYMYNINSFDKAASTITIYPRLPRNVTTGKIWYQQGSALFTIGNDTSNLRVNTLQAIICGIGANLRSLYGCNISTFISEGLGVGVVLGTKSETVIGNIIGSGYFEGNMADIAYGWSSDICSMPVLTEIALNPKKIISLAPFRIYNDTLGYSEFQHAFGDITLGNATYNAAYNLPTGDLTNPSKVHFITFWDEYTLTLSQDLEKKRLFAKSSALYVFAGGYATRPTGTVTIKAPSGGKINNAAQITIDATKYDKAILVYVYAVDDNNYLATIITPPSQIKNSVTYDPSSLATATQQSTTVTLTGAIVGDTVAVSFSNPLQGTRMWAEATADNTVTVYHRNDTGAAVDIASGTLTVKVV